MASITDLFSPEERIELKLSELTELIKNGVKEELIENALRCRLPHEHILCMLTGNPEPDLLEQYKSTGLTPEQLLEIDAEYRILSMENAELKRGQTELENLKEQDRLVELPCKIGDTVFSLDRFCSGDISDCQKHPCVECADYELEIYEEPFKLTMLEDFGKKVFLTREEAEKAKHAQKSGDV